jgi:hypothetical protein
MKMKLSLALAFSLLATLALASITLTNQTTYSVGGSTTETNSASGVNLFQVDYLHPALSFTIQKGTVAGQVLNPGAHARSEDVQISINLTTGFWSSTNGASGTLSGAALTNVQTTLKNLRNSMETFAVNNAATDPGTQVAW